MSTDPLSRCRWPVLRPPHAAALREAVAFVFEETEPLGVVATGTVVRGGGDASSDLDVYVIHDAPYRRRVQRWFRGVPAEIFVNPPHLVRAYLAEEHEEGRPITAHMLATGFVVYDASDGVVDRLRGEAAEWLARRTVLSDDALVRARYAAATRLEDGADVTATDPHTAAMLLTRAVVAMLELWCTVHDGRVPRDKELLATVAARDAALGADVHAFFSAAGAAERLAAAEAIADRTIGVRGFFPWDSGPAPVRTADS